MPEPRPLSNSYEERLGLVKRDCNLYLGIEIGVGYKDYVRNLLENRFLPLKLMCTMDLFALGDPCWLGHFRNYQRKLKPIDA